MSDIRPRALLLPAALAALAGLTVLAAPSAAAGERPELALPVACALGKDCFVQNWVDLDPGPGVLDAGCGANSYDGHKGLDIRLLSAAEVAAGVAVLAAAPGKVTAVRDAMPDHFSNRAGVDVEGRECGNGVVIDHGAGWLTQYCHMRLGSISVKVGDTVSAGTPLGAVGYSGAAEFPHIHLALRHDGRTVDPVTGREPDAACGLAAEGSAFAPAVARALAYDHGQYIETGFAAGPLTTAALEGRATPWPAPRRDQPALVFFARSIHLEKGDVQRLVLAGPAGVLRDVTMKPVDRNKAHYVAFAGLKQPDGGFPPGRYEGRAELIRGGKVVATTSAVAEMR
ncbi:MAG: M23 family metallopeptidase [Hyphomicrobiales bacterium]